MRGGVLERGVVEWEWNMKCYKITKWRGPGGVQDCKCGSRMEVHGEALDCTEEATSLEKTTEAPKEKGRGDGRDLGGPAFKRPFSLRHFWAALL